MNQKTFTLVAGLIFLLVAVMHLLRVLLNWPAVIGIFVVPVWASWFGLVVAGFLAYTGIALSKKS